jgi:uncharacterized protein (DUF952 family)
MIYHITTSQDWERAKLNGCYSADSLANEGFIHCSTAEQVQATANRFYRNCPNLVLLHIDDELLNSAVVYENLEGGSILFPHIYESIPVAAITKVQNLSVEADGSFSINLS